MDEKLYGYIRVSSAGQNEARQLEAMAEIGIPEENIYIDKCSGADFLRPQYLRMLRRLKPRDTLYIADIDRLGRNYVEIKEQWRILTKQKEVNIIVLNMPLLNTNKIKDLMTNFIADLVLQILSFVAQQERENIKERQAQGIAIAKASGVRFGRPPKPLPENFMEAYELWRSGNISEKKAANMCQLPLSTFYVKAKNIK